MNVSKNISPWLMSMMLVAGAACDDFLDESDPSNFATDNYFTQPAHAESIVIATYQSLYPMQTSQAWLITELRTGAANSAFSANGGFPSFQLVRSLDMSADHPSVEQIWNSHYQGIGNANLAISRIPGINMDEAKKSRLLGEVRFLRAYYYFNLVRIFGEVPLILQPVDLRSDELNPMRSSVADIYELITEDLTSAEGSGLPFNDESGRVTLGAVKSLLADVYLTMAGFPLQLGQGYYELARAKAKEVIDAQEYTLFESYEAFRDKSTDNTGEYIFMIQFDEIEQPSNSLQIGLPPFKLGVSAYASEQGFSFAQGEFVNSYETGDNRAEEGVFFFSKFTSESNRNDSIEFGNFYNYKFFDESAHLNTAQSGLNWQVIRYADVLLDFAEATNELLGPTDEAYDAINSIRTRANIPKLGGLSTSEFREAIWKERWHEQYFEGEIWFDMTRTRKVYDFENETFNDYVGHAFVDGIILEERHLIFPIPTPEIRNNPNLEQNVGY
jgi:starch-binding outer membrane protein, SusD/RagB family